MSIRKRTAVKKSKPVSGRPARNARLSTWDGQFKKAIKAGATPEKDLFEGLANEFDKKGMHVMKSLAFAAPLSLLKRLRPLAERVAGCKAVLQTMFS